MIQRIQTIYLFLAFISVALLFVFPVFSISAGDIIISEFTSHGFQSVDKLNEGGKPFYILYIFMALFSGFGILLYKNRKKQLLVVRMGIIVHVIVSIGFLLFAFIKKAGLVEKLEESGVEGGYAEFGFELGYYLLFMSIAFLVLATRGIRADEKLVKSLDRLR